ncbi:hypothetical protein [Methanobrevibacter sp.]
MIEEIKNTNMKRLLSKKRMSVELLMELKTSLFIYPAKPAGDNNYFFHYSTVDDREVFYLFTSCEEYFKSFTGNEDGLKPIFIYLNDLDDALYSEMSGIIINPGSDDFLIPTYLAYHIIKDIEENNGIYEDYFKPVMVDKDNGLLHKYCHGKKTFKFYDKLFRYLNWSTLYSLIYSENDLNDFFVNDELNLGDVDASFFKINSHYVLYSDLNLLKDDIKGRKGYFYYLHADAVQFVQLALEFDYEGIILKTPEGDYSLPRKSLLKHYEKIINEYQRHDNTNKYAFKLEDD